MSFNDLYVAILTGFILICLIPLILVAGGRLVASTWRSARAVGRTTFIFAALILCLYAGTKPSDAPRRVAPRTGDDPYRRPEGANSNAAWNAHGVHEAWCLVTFISSSLIAFTGGYLRETPRDLEHQFGETEPALYAASDISDLWWTEDPDGTRTVTWKDFFTSADTNSPTSRQIVLYPNGDYLVRSNDCARLYPYVYNPTNDTTLCLDLAVPAGVCRYGTPQLLRASAHSERRMTGSLTLDCTTGADRVQLWADAQRTQSLELPYTWDVEESDEFACWVDYASTSATTNDIRFTLQLENCPYTLGAETTSFEVTEVALSSNCSGASANPPPFDPYRAHTFHTTRSPSPDQHLVVFFEDALTNAAPDLSITACLNTQPAGVQVTADWERLLPSPASGDLITEGLAAELRNPREGGVYHLRASLMGTQHECNIVLPLAGAEINGQVRHDLDEADAFVAHSRAAFTRRWYARPHFGYKWFLRRDYGFYRGRANNATNETVWCYNQVNDTTGLGSVVTLNGRTVRLEKLSNLLAAYACEKLGVTRFEQALSQVFGTGNDVTATASWAAGVELAHGTAFDTVIDGMQDFIWSRADVKNRRLWPNLAPADNHDTTISPTDFNYHYYSPGFIYARP